MRIALRLALFASCTALFSLLLIAASKHASLHAQQPTDDLDNRLLQAARNDDAGAVAQFLDQGANIEARDVNRDTPLMVASGLWHGSVAELLLQRGANSSAKNKQGDTALVIAARAGNVEIVHKLLRRGTGKDERVRALFEAAHGGPVVLTAGQDEDQPIQAPVETPWTATVRLLLASGVDPESRDAEGTPLIVAASYAQTEAVQMLLRRGANVKARDRRGNTALLSAACECALATMNSGYDSVKLLLEAGSDVNARTNDGTTALMSAAGGYGGLHILTLLVDRGANPNLKNGKGQTALSIAKEERRPEEIAFLRLITVSH